MVLRPYETHSRPSECTLQRSASCAFSSGFMCLQALCAAVVLPDVLQTMALVFSGADVMCATGDPTVSTPYLLAQRAGQRLQMEFLHQNKLSGKQLWVPPPLSFPSCTKTPAVYSHLADLTLDIRVKQSVSYFTQKSSRSQFCCLKWRMLPPDFILCS